MRKMLFAPLLIIFLFLSQMANADFYLDAVKVVCDGNNLSIEGTTLSDDEFEEVLRNNKFSIINKGFYETNVIGLSLSNISEDLAKQHNLIVGKGVFIHKAYLDGAAYKAGIRDNDVILTINNEEVNSAHWLLEEINRHEVLTEMYIAILRQNDSSMQVRGFSFIPDTKKIEMEGYGNELYEIFYKIQDKPKDLEKLKKILKNEKNLFINYNKEKNICELSLGTIETVFNAIPTSGKGQCGAGDWGFTINQSINNNIVFNEFHMEKISCFKTLNPYIEKIDLNFENPKRINVILNGSWNYIKEDINPVLPMDEVFIIKNLEGCDNFTDYEPQCESEYEIKEFKFDLN